MHQIESEYTNTHNCYNSLCKVASVAMSDAAAAEDAGVPVAAVTWHVISLLTYSPCRGAFSYL